VILPILRVGTGGSCPERNQGCREGSQAMSWCNTVPNVSIHSFVLQCFSVWQYTSNIIMVSCWWIPPALWQAHVHLHFFRLYCECTSIHRLDWSLVSSQLKLSFHLLLIQCDWEIHQLLCVTSLRKSVHILSTPMSIFITFVAQILWYPSLPVIIS
jgi:hypothetical protein